MIGKHSARRGARWRRKGAQARGTGAAATATDGAATATGAAAGRNADRDAGAAERGELGYRPNVNQVRHEPMPASHDADQRQEAVVRNEELGTGNG